MSKAKVRFADEVSDESEYLQIKRPRFVDIDDNDCLTSNSGSSGLPKPDNEHQSQHTLDSDEEEEIKYEKLDVNEVDGQEDSEEEFEGDVKIMAFNMKEDMEDGHFDTEGNFIFNKKEREIKDEWLDNIDWTHVKKDAGKNWHTVNEEDDATQKSMADDELKSVYSKSLAYLKPGETIERAMKRLGKKTGISAAEDRKRRWAAKKDGKAYILDENSNAVKELTGLADSLVSKGEFEAYQYSYERLIYLIRSISHKAVDDLDIFSSLAPTIPQKAAPMAYDNDDLKDGVGTEAIVVWEYKICNDDDAELFGPKTSAEMLQLQTDGKFDNGGWARKCGTQAYYSISRLDFEIYI